MTTPPWGASTGSAGEDLFLMAAPYALHALSEADMASVERQVQESSAEVADAFHAEVRDVRETMAIVASATALEPPVQLRETILGLVAQDNVRTLPAQSGRRRWARGAAAAAAAVVIGLGALGVGYALRQAPTQTAAEQIFTAPDVETVSGDIPGGGSATVVFSRERNSGVLVMNDVTPPQAGTVYQMWLIDADGPHSAGTMDAGAVAPSTTAVLPDLGSSQTLAFTVEPPGGSAQPTGAIIAQLPLI